MSSYLINSHLPYVISLTEEHWFILRRGRGSHRLPLSRPSDARSARLSLSLSHSTLTTAPDLPPLRSDVVFPCVVQTLCGPGVTVEIPSTANSLTDDNMRFRNAHVRLLREYNLAANITSARDGQRHMPSTTTIKMEGKT
ncbi:hypothetical protein CPAR01_00209 [Colletotrichum paranaense]|uniref:Ubiquitinyl hydrolase 1 n=1 Tax=Colletotrichum paranaense TaxID=1914294 RepID=A0ABQ9T367_9PEZI|nr:uncharacterized protein CPAR01_00209 [Colletotrichum paranaense]KAK1546242.1 hypothetical protein CPAR01_00209 [Colletotrichum paranaense]